MYGTLWFNEIGGSIKSQKEDHLFDGRPQMNHTWFN